MVYRRIAFLFAAAIRDSISEVVSLAIDEIDGEFMISSEIRESEGSLWREEPMDIWGEFGDKLFEKHGDYDVFFSSFEEARTEARSILQSIDRSDLVEIFNCLQC